MQRAFQTTPCHSVTYITLISPRFTAVLMAIPRTALTKAFWQVLTTQLRLRSLLSRIRLQGNSFITARHFRLLPQVTLPLIPTYHLSIPYTTVLRPIERLSNQCSLCSLPYNRYRWPRLFRCFQTDREMDLPA